MENFVRNETNQTGHVQLKTGYAQGGCPLVEKPLDSPAANISKRPHLWSVFKPRRTSLMLGVTRLLASRLCPRCRETTQGPRVRFHTVLHSGLAMIWSELRVTKFFDILRSALCARGHSHSHGLPRVNTLTSPNQTWRILEI